MSQENKNNIDPRLNHSLQDLVRIVPLEPEHDDPDPNDGVMVGFEITDPQALSDLYQGIQDLHVVEKDSGSEQD